MHSVPINSFRQWACSMVVNSYVACHGQLRTMCRSSAGVLMHEAQREFDAKAAPLCPEHLTSPALHRVLAYQPIQEHVWGGKGVGSQACLAPVLWRLWMRHGCNLNQPAMWISRCTDVIHLATSVRESLMHLSHLQGDGTAQFVCRSPDDQAAACEILERDLGLHCTRLTLQPTSGMHSTAELQVTRHARSSCTL